MKLVRCYSVLRPCCLGSAVAAVGVAAVAAALLELRAGRGCCCAAVGQAGVRKLFALLP